MNETQFLSLVFGFPVFLMSTTVHEAAHAWAALRGGDPTAYEGGQVTLSPLPHIRREPVGMVVVPLLTSIANGWTMGWASAPFDPAWARRHPRRAAWMAAAGPAANLLLALIAFALIKAGLAAGVFAAPPSVSFSSVIAPESPGALFGVAGAAGFVAHALSVMLMLNVLLAAFNLVPLPPLDGATAIDLLLPRGMAGIMRGLGPMGSMLGMLLAWKLFPSIARPLFLAVVSLVHPGLYR